MGSRWSVVGVLFAASAARAGAPDPGSSSVDPWDGYGHALVIPGSASDLDDVTIVVRDASGTPLPNVDVSISLSGCEMLCIDSPDDGLTGTTGGSGEVTLNPRVGGCAICDVVVVADGVEIRSLSRVVSPDWDGVIADGVVTACDSAYFAGALGSSDPCADYDGDGVVGVFDLPFLAARGESNAQTCLPVVDPDSSTVLPGGDRVLAAPGAFPSSFFPPCEITVKDSTGRAICGMPVELDLAACSGLCLDSPDDGSQGVTGLDGRVELLLRVGGCADCEMPVRAGGTVLHTYACVRTPDWDGCRGDGQVNLGDAIYVGRLYESGGYDTCSDLQENGQIDVVDFAAVGSYLGERNDALCLPPVSPSLSTVSPWDDAGQAMVCPGQLTPVDSVAVVVRDTSGVEIPCSFVQLDLEQCAELCKEELILTHEDVDLSPDSSGVTGFNPRIGGCEDCPVVVRAFDQFDLRTFGRVVSPDFDGTRADGIVDDADAAFFAQALGTQDACADYDGDGFVTLLDQAILTAGLGGQNDSLCGGGTGVAAVGSERPATHSLDFANPQPAEGIGTLSFALPEAAHVVLEVYDVRGALVARLVDGTRGPGRHEVLWNARNGSGNPPASGVYFVRLEAGGAVITKKLTFVR